MNINKNFLIIIAFLLLFSFLPISYKQFANALNPADYAATKTGLNSTDWQRLPADFVAKSGDTMTGTLNVPNLNVTGTCTGCGASNPVDTSGNGMKMMCSRTSPSSWQSYSTSILYVDVVIPLSAGFTGVPQYFTSISGDTQHYRLSGGSSIYLKPNLPTGERTFRVYAVYDTTITPATAQSYGWAIDWCAIGH